VNPRLLLLLPAIAFLAAAPLRAEADLLNRVSSVEEEFNAVAVDLLGGKVPADDWNKAVASSGRLQADLNDPSARTEWNDGLSAKEPADNLGGLATTLGNGRGRLQHTLALEMLAAQKTGDLEQARAWRALIKLPRHANAVEGALALQILGADPNQRAAVQQLLAREYIMWQTTRIREKLDEIRRLVAKGRSTPELVRLRAAEAQALGQFPSALLQAAGSPALPSGEVASWNGVNDALLQNASAEILGQRLALWQDEIETRLPNLLSEDDVNRRERLVLKLIRLVPKEYLGGVKDGQVLVAIEYREAQSFTVQAQQLISELLPTWRKTKAEAVAQNLPAVQESLASLEEAINAKVPPAEISKSCDTLTSLLQDKFGLTLLRKGKASDIIAETVLDVRSLLTQSLAAAQAGRWSEAESFRIDAYTNFDLEIERRVLPRDPELGIRAERSFLDGRHGQPGIKALLDARVRGPRLEEAYQQTLNELNACQAVLQVGLSPATATFTAMTIVTREGLEAVIILAALLAGLRGPENAFTRKRIVMGAWLALLATGVTFVLSKTLLESLSHYGELLEAVISILAVIILLMVTNWVFHKVYWVSWNAKLRDLSRLSEETRNSRWEGIALIGVGFLTIYREGFETTLFMQSLILEAGIKPAAMGLLLGGGIITAMGIAVFWLGAKLPYRKLLVITGVLVVSILITFLGSTVRLFQILGWLPIHPIDWLEIPTWMGLWLGFYPSWEGMLIPLLGLGYVGGAWLFVKWRNRPKALEARAAAVRKTIAAAPDHAKADASHAFMAK
jgi:high-affinity iron transporter